MATHSDSGKVRDQFQFPGSQSTDLRITVFKKKQQNKQTKKQNMDTKSFTDLDPKIYHLAPHAKI